MRRFLSILTALSLCASLASAQVPMTGAGLGKPAAAGSQFLLADTGSKLLVDTGVAFLVQ